MIEVFTALILLSNLLLLFLLCSLFFSERATSESDDHEASDADDETNNHVNESGEAESKSNERFLIKVQYEDRETVLKQWFVPIISGILDIDIDEFRDRITKLFGLPRYSDLDLRYYDEDGLLTTITDDDDVQEIMMQKTDHVMIYARISNNAGTKQVGGGGGGGGGAGFEPICTLKPINTSAPPEADFDDWLIT